MTSDMDRMAGTGGRGQDDGAATGDSTMSVSGADSGRMTNQTDFAAGGTADADAPRPGWQPDDGPPIVSERDADEADIQAGAGGGTDDRRAGSTDRFVEAARTLDGLDEDGGTRIAGPQDRSDIGNLRGGQDDAATGGSDLGPTTGGGDTGAV